MAFLPTGVTVRVTGGQTWTGGMIQAAYTLVIDFSPAPFT